MSATFPAMGANLNHPGHYFHWGVVQISLANLIVIGLMLALFALALVLPFPHGTAVEGQAVDVDDD